MVLAHSEKEHVHILCLAPFKCPVHFSGTHKVNAQASTDVLRIFFCVLFGTSWMDVQLMKDVLPLGVYVHFSAEFYDDNIT